MAEQPRRTLKKTLRHPSPAIESWLAQVPSTAAKLTPEELRQWKHDNEGRSGRGWFVCSIVLRVLSLVSAFITAVIGLSMIEAFFYDGGYRLAPMIVPGVVVSVWDAIEFVVVCARKSHRGMPRVVHLPADGLICLLVAISIAGFFLFIFNDGYWFYPNGSSWWYSGFGDPAVRYVVVLVFLIILLLIHATFFFFLLCSRQFRKSRHIFTPRIMYLPATGEPVVVLERPFPPGAIHQLPQKSPASPALELGTVPPTFESEADPESLAGLHNVAVGESHAAGAPTAGPSQQGAVTGDGGQKGPHLQVVPPRKPVPGPRSTGTHYATAWPPDHIPDEAEQARAARGESQAQWMTLAGPPRDWGKPSKNIEADDAAREGEKSDLCRSTAASGVRKP